MYESVGVRTEEPLHSARHVAALPHSTFVTPVGQDPPLFLPPRHVSERSATAISRAPRRLAKSSRPLPPPLPLTPTPCVLSHLRSGCSPPLRLVRRFYLFHLRPRVVGSRKPLFLLLCFPHPHPLAPPPTKYGREVVYKSDGNRRGFWPSLRRPWTPNRARRARTDGRPRVADSAEARPQG